MHVAEMASRFLFGGICLGCGRGEGPLDPWLCRHCAQELMEYGSQAQWPVEGNTLCLYPMNPLTRKLILAMKYQSLPGLAGYMVAKSSAANHGEAWSFFQGHTVGFLPVPVHTARLRERGYNQCERVAGALARYCGGRCSSAVLRRVRYSDSQTRLGSAERGSNVAGAFAVAPGTEVKGKDWVVVDDVYTTGATTGACARALERAGARRVHICAVVYERPMTAALDWVADQALGAWEEKR